MRKFTVLLLYPDTLARNFGQETYLTSVDAPDVPTAKSRAQQQAGSDNHDECDPEDFYVLAVFAGDHCDIKDSSAKVAPEATCITICFQRHYVDPMRMVAFTTTAKDEAETLVRLQKALDAWMNSTSEGKRAWFDSSEDFNIGDLSSYFGANGQVTDPDLAKELEAQGIFAIDIVFNCSSTNVVAYDKVLAAPAIKDEC